VNGFPLRLVVPDSRLKMFSDVELLDQPGINYEQKVTHPIPHSPYA
jgi:hypothetical protein